MESEARTLTRDEHRARALLLGYRGYNHRLGYYFRFIEKFPRYEYMCAVTLEVIHYKEVEDRKVWRMKNTFSKEGRDWFDIIDK